MKSLVVVLLNFVLAANAFSGVITLPARTSIGIISSNFVDFRKECDDSNLKTYFKSDLMLNGKKIRNIGKTLLGSIEIYKIIDKGQYIVIIYGSNDNCCKGNGCPEFPNIYVAKINAQSNVIVTDTKLINNIHDNNGVLNNININDDKLIFPSYDEGPKQIQLIYDMNKAKLIRIKKSNISKFKEYCNHMYNVYSKRLTDEKCFRVDPKTSRKVFNTQIVKLFDEECNACRGELAFLAKDKAELTRFNSICIESCKNGSIYNYDTFEKKVCNLR